MFFERREQSSVMHKRLDYILLFILRTLMLVLLALLFANPFYRRSTPKAEGKKIVVVAVDHSFSMRAMAGGESRLDKAKREAMDVLGKIPPATAAEVVALGGQLQAMTQQTTDPSELRAAVASIQPSDGRASFGDIARFARQLSEASKTPVELHVISDLQKSAHAAGLHRSAPEPGHHADPASGRRRASQLDGGERVRESAHLRSQAVSHSGHHRGLRHARGRCAPYR